MKGVFYLLEQYNEILTLDEMCEILNIGKNTAYRLLNNKEVNGFKIGHVWKIPKTFLKEYITQKKT
jgi:excisionase family DNA binding protein